METEAIDRINEKGRLKIRKIQIRQRVPHERRQWNFRLLKDFYLFLPTRLILLFSPLYFNKKYNYEFIIFTLLLILLIKN